MDCDRRPKAQAGTRTDDDGRSRAGATAAAGMAALTTASDWAAGYWPQRVAALFTADAGAVATGARLAHWCLPSRRQQAGRFSSTVEGRAASSGASSVRLKSSNSELETIRRKNSILAEFASPATVALRLLKNRPS